LPEDLPMRAMTMFLLAGLAAPGLAHAAVDCSAASQPQPLQPTVVAPVASELAPGLSQLGAPEGVLARAYDEAQSVDQVLLRIRIETCRNMAMATPAPGVVSPDNPAAYKPRTQFDNTPWRFNMSQNGKNMTAEEFDAWMKAKGVRVARGNGAAAAPSATTVPAVAGAATTTAAPAWTGAPAPAAAPAPGGMAPAPVASGDAWGTGQGAPAATTPIVPVLPPVAPETPPADAPTTPR